MTAQSVPALVDAARAARQSGQRAESFVLFQAAIRLQPRHPGLRMEAAADLRALDRLAEAEAEYWEILAGKPGHVAARLGLGQCARLRGDRAAALAHFEAASAADPAHVRARLETANELRGLGRTGEAETAWQAVLDLVPGHKAALLGLAAGARSRGDLAASLDLCRRAVAVDPTDTWARMQFAADLLALHRIAPAEAEYGRIIDMDPDHGGALLGLGRCARQRSDPAAALAWHRRAALAAPQDVWHRLECAADLRELGELDAARQVAEAALAIEPDNAAALLSLGHTERQGGRHECALAAFARAHAVQPARAEALLQMAIEHRTLGRLPACDALLAQAAALEPDSVAVLLQRAEAARLAGDIARMHAMLADARTRRSGVLALELAYADSLALSGRVPEALAHVETLGPAGCEVALKRVSLLRRAGLWPGALAHARQATADWPGDFSAWMERLACETLLGSPDAVDECLMQARARSPGEYARLARARGLVHEERGDFGSALSCYATASELDPSQAETPFLAARLALATLDVDRARAALTTCVRATAPSFRLRGRTPNASQTHFGQILDEYTLDAPTLATLRGLHGLALGDRIERILELVTANPDSTAAAVAVLGALHDAKYLGRTIAGTGTPSCTDIPSCTAIPRTIVQFWDTPAIPQDVRSMMQSWADLNPDFAVRRFDDAGAYAFVAAQYGQQQADLYARIRGAAQKADVFRLGYLAALGGIYADGDDRCHAPLGSILPPLARLVVYREDVGTVGNNFIAAAPGHPILERAWRLALASLARGDEDTVWLSTGPGLLTRALAGAIAESGSGWADWFPALAIIERRDLFRAVAIHCLAAYKVTGHWSALPRSPPNVGLPAGATAEGHLTGSSKFFDPPRKGWTFSA